MQTCVVAVDFNDGARVYNVVREALQGKDVAILGACASATAMLERKCKV